MHSASITVTDHDQAMDFYVTKLGFTAVGGMEATLVDPFGNQFVLRQDD